MGQAFDRAARDQYRRGTVYAVFLVGPGGERERVARTARKSGSGLLGVMYLDTVQARIRQFPGAAELRIARKTAERLEFSNGWALVFGGTIREEGAEADRRAAAGGSLFAG